MGTCYSRQGALHGKESLPLRAENDSPAYDTMPHPTQSGSAPVTADNKPPSGHSARGGFGFKRPTGQQHPKPGKNSNEQSNRDAERTTLGTLSDNTSVDGENNRKKPTSSGRFGFRGRGGNKNSKPRGLPVSPSIDSVKSECPQGQEVEARRIGRSGSLPSKQPSLKKAYIPRSNTGSWRMIDDTSSVYSSVSGRDKKSDSIAAGQSEDFTKSAASTPVKGIPALIKAPIAQMESLETLPRNSVDNGKPSRGRGSRNGHSGLLEKGQSRFRAPFSKKSTLPNGGSQSNGSTAPSNLGNGVKNNNNKSEPNAIKNNKKPNSFLKKGFLRKQKSSDSQSASRSESPCEQTKSSGSPAPTVEQSIDHSPPSVIDHKVMNDQKPVEEPVVTSTAQIVANQAPAPDHDVTDTLSLGSIHSDDLILDGTLPDEPVMNAPVVEKGRPRSRSRSGSRSQSYERRAAGGAGERRDKLRESKSSVTSPEESLDELAMLVEASGLSTGSATYRRRERLQRAPRPMSFPGPGQRSRGNSVTEAGQSESAVSMRPPRLGSVCQDEDDMITIDAFTYRHLVQDVNAFKTMLLKLKRLIQEDEFQGQNWKNGFKVTGSQPTSPFDEATKFTFAAALLEPDDSSVKNGGGMDDIVKDNLELRRQNVCLQHQVEEHERTIKLLQQQMTKYECGYSDPGGKAFSHSQTQTDKMSGFYKNTGSYRTACARRTSSTSSSQQGAAQASRYRTEFRHSPRTFSSATASDEVFLLEQMSSLDPDEDLDMLMEDFSLGSDLESVSDAASAASCGRRQHRRRSSAANTAMARREAAIAQRHLESSLSQERRDSLQGRRDSHQVAKDRRDSLQVAKDRRDSLAVDRRDSLAVDRRDSMPRRDSLQVEVPRPPRDRRQSRSERPRSLFAQDRLLSRSSVKDAQMWQAIDNRESMSWDYPPVEEDLTPDSVFGDVFTSIAEEVSSPVLSIEEIVDRSISPGYLSPSRSAQSPASLVLMSSQEGSVSGRSPRSRSPEILAADSMTGSWRSEGGRSDNARRDSVRSSLSRSDSLRSHVARSDSVRSSLSRRDSLRLRQILSIGKADIEAGLVRCGSVTPDGDLYPSDRSESNLDGVLPEVTLADGPEPGEPRSDGHKSAVEPSDDAESGFGTGEREEMSALCETLADNLAATKLDNNSSGAGPVVVTETGDQSAADNNNPGPGGDCAEGDTASDTAQLLQRARPDHGRRHTLSKQVRVAEVCTRLSQQHTIASANMASKGYAATGRFVAPRYQRGYVPPVYDRHYLRPPTTARRNIIPTMGGPRKSASPHRPTEPRHKSPVDNKPLRKTPSPESRKSSSPARKSPTSTRNTPSPSSDKRRLLPSPPTQHEQSGPLCKQTDQSGALRQAGGGSSRLPRPGSGRGRPGVTVENRGGRPYRYT